MTVHAKHIQTHTYVGAHMHILTHTYKKYTHIGRKQLNGHLKLLKFNTSEEQDLALSVESLSKVLQSQDQTLVNQALSFFAFQPVPHNWFIKACCLYYSVYGIVHIKHPLLITICLMLV